MREFVEKLREKAAIFSKSDFAVAGISKDYKEAADIIEKLAEKLSSANMERSEQYYSGPEEAKQIPTDHFTERFNKVV